MSLLPGPLVSAAWLSAQLVRRGAAAGSGGLRIVDSSWYMPSAKRDPAGDFEEKRMNAVLLYIE